MFRYFLALPLVAFSTPALACYNSEAGAVYSTSNSYDVKVTVDGAAKDTSKNGGSWGVKRDKSISGTAFNFVINMDRETSGINGIQFSFHTDKPIVEWKVGETQTFKPYKSIGGEVNELSYNQFVCGSEQAGGGRKFHSGNFASMIIDQNNLGPVDRFWYLDRSQSTATLTAVEDGFTSGKNQFSLSATMNLVYVRPASERWKDGGKLKETGEKRVVKIELDGLRFVTEKRRQRRR